MSQPIDAADIFREIRDQQAARGELAVRHVAHLLDGTEVLVGLDHRGRHVLYLDLMEPAGSGELWRSFGLVVEAHEQPALIVRHEGERGVDQFALLCNELVDVLRAEGDRRLEDVVLEVIKDWASLFAHRPLPLTRESVAGLLGELLVLRRLVDSCGAEAALGVWTGPDLRRHDFVGPAGALEVKSVMAEEGLSATFHGLRQLAAPVRGDLHLALLQFEDTPQGDLTLESVIAGLPAGVRSDARLDQALSRMGLHPRDLSPSRGFRFHLRDSRLLHVGDDFPRLAPDVLVDPGWADAISRVTYTVDLSGREDVSVSEATAIGLDA